MGKNDAVTGSSTDSSSEHPLVGTWRLEDWRTLGVPDDQDRPFGERPDGILVYTAGGTMITTIGRAHRPAFGAADATGATDQEHRAAITSFIAYAGRWRVKGSTVIHAVELSLVPNWVGTDQRRTFSLDPEGNRLVLTSPPVVIGGRPGRQQLTWRRA